MQLALVVLFGQHRGCQVIVQREVALKHGVDLAQKGRVGVQTGDFVFVLVSHQFEQVACHRFGQRGFSERGFCDTYFFDKSPIGIRVGRILIGR